MVGGGGGASAPASRRRWFWEAYIATTTTAATAMGTILAITTAGTHIMAIDTTVRFITIAVIGTTARAITTVAIATTDTGTIGPGTTGTATTVHAGTTMADTATGFAGEVSIPQCRLTHEQTPHDFYGTASGWEEKMAYRYQRTGESAGQWANMPMAPNIALTAWISLLTAATNAQAIGELGGIAAEWQAFVGRRLNEDVALLQRLTRTTGPDQVIAAYADFWRKAGEDYGNEIATMTKQMTDMTSKMAVAAHSATEEASTRLSHREAA